jgi:HSP20 family molecular chaperone IbpA
MPQGGESNQLVKNLPLKGEHTGEVGGDTHDPFVRSTRAFTRRFVLEEPVEPKGITTLCTDGKLAVCVPKAAERDMAPPAVMVST